MLISRQPPSNAPRVNTPATGTATAENSSRIASDPNRCRACVIPPELGRLHPPSQHPHPANVSISRAATSS
jgi:hypothetical protein